MLITNLVLKSYLKNVQKEFLFFTKLLKHRSKMILSKFMWAFLPTTFYPKLPFIFQQAEVVGRKSEQNQEG